METIKKEEEICDLLYVHMQKSFNKAPNQSFEKQINKIYNPLAKVTKIKEKNTKFKNEKEDIVSVPTLI